MENYTHNEQLDAAFKDQQLEYLQIKYNQTTIRDLFIKRQNETIQYYNHLEGECEKANFTLSCKYLTFEGVDNVIYYAVENYRTKALLNFKTLAEVDAFLVGACI